MVPLILNQSNKGLFGWSTFFLKTIYLLGIIISFCCLIQAAFFSPSGFQWDNFVYEKLATLSGLQPIYLSLFLILSSLSWYQLFLLGEFKKFRVHFASPVFLYLMVVLLSSRTELMVYVGGFLLILLRHFWGQKIIIFSSVLLFSLLTVVMIMCSKTNAGRFAEMVDVKSDYKSNRWGGRSLRIEKWRNTLECYMNFPILGTGAGDCGDELRKTYQKNNFEIALKANYNPHNQFLQTLLTLGPIGLFFLLGIFGFMLRRADRNQDFPLFLLVIVFAFSMITESMLERQSGIFLFTVLTCFFAAVSKSQEAEFAVEN
jgi:O-antigen ligase